MLYSQKPLLLNALVLFITISLFGCGSSDIQKAQEFMKAGMYPQAMELLNKRIGEKPSDAEAHFLMGICNIRTNNFGVAKERFASAVRLKSDYGFQIGSEYKKAGNEALSKDVSSALVFYREALNYQPALKDEIGSELFTEGKGLFEKGQHQPASARFMAANSIKPELGASIADYYFQAGKKPDVQMELKALCLESAVRYDKKPEYLQANSDYHYELSKTAKTTEDAIRELEMANRFGGKYGAELKAKQEALEQEKFMALVKKYEAERGKAKYIRLEKPGELKLAAEFLSDKRVCYLSLEDFKITDGNKFTSTWEKFCSELGKVELRTKGNGETQLSFVMDKIPTDVYYWVEEL